MQSLYTLLLERPIVVLQPMNLLFTIDEVDEKSLEHSVLEYQESGGSGSPTFTRKDKKEETLNPE